MVGISKFIVEFDRNCELLINKCTILYIYIVFLNNIALYVY